jgi:hypothetical protein
MGIGWMQLMIVVAGGLFLVLVAIGIVVLVVMNLPKQNQKS